MPFSLHTHQALTVNGQELHVCEHPILPGMAYAQEGRKSLMYKLCSEDGIASFALKVLKPAFHSPHIAANALHLNGLGDRPGLRACRRHIVTCESEPQLVSAMPGLQVAVLMPWVDGDVWSAIVTSRRAVMREISFSAALSASQVLSDLERDGLAHCDVAGENVLRDLASGHVELVDLEDMFGPGLLKPRYVPAGRPGYRHRQSVQGQWCASADRFAGAVLLAEMLAWHRAEIRESAYGEQYFCPGETQQRGSRYKLLVNVLAAISNELGELFGRAWHSASLAECPALQEWNRAIRQLFELAGPVSPVACTKNR